MQGCHPRLRQPKQMLLRLLSLPSLPAGTQAAGRRHQNLPTPLHLACQQKRAESSKDMASAPFPPPNLLEDQAVG